MNDEPIVIEVEMVDSVKEKIIKSSPTKIKLYPDYMTYLIQFDFEALDDEMEDVLKGQTGYRYNNYTIKKSSIHSTLIYFVQKTGRYVFEIYFGNEIVHIHFEKYENAKKCKQCVDNWLFPQQ